MILHFASPGLPLADEQVTPKQDIPQQGLTALKMTLLSV